MLMTELERGSARALYEQLSDQLRASLIDTPNAGTRLPTEESLMQTFSVSRSTVRKAVQQLVDEGVLIRRQGKGTFVARAIPKIVHSIDRLAPFFETFKRAGEALETKVIDFSWDESPDLPEVLKNWERPVLGYKRLYISNGVPHALTQVYVPLKIGRRISRADVEQLPIYDILRKRLRLDLARAEFLVSCRAPSQELSACLDLSPSSSLLVLERMTHNKAGDIVELTRHYLRPDVYQLSVNLSNLNHEAEKS